MVWVSTKKELLEKAKLLIGTKVDTTPVGNMSIDTNDIIEKILAT